MKRSINMTTGDVLSARAFHVCTGQIGSPLMATSTFEREASGEIHFDPESPWKAAREKRTIERAKRGELVG